MSDINGQSWDVALWPIKDKTTLSLYIPKSLARTMTERGYNRARIQVTELGLLVTPYASEEKRKRGQQADAVLPEWS